jgi:hypothetical protein
MYSNKVDSVSFSVMSSRLQHQENFIRLLLTSHKDITISLLQKVNRPQAQAIWEITLNILDSNIKLSPYYRKKLKQNRKFYIQLGSRKIRFQEKINLIRSHSNLVFNLLKAVRKDLLIILDGCNKDDITD